MDVVIADNFILAVRDLSPHPTNSNTWKLDEVNAHHIKILAASGPEGQYIINQFWGLGVQPVKEPGNPAGCESSQFSSTDDAPLLAHFLQPPEVRPSSLELLLPRAAQH